VISADVETVHATAVAWDGRAVLLFGQSGAGKSDLALRLIDRGWVLVSDDYTVIRRDGGAAVAEPPATIAGRIEVRGVGIVAVPHAASVPVALLCDLDAVVERMPDRTERVIAGVSLPSMTLAAFEASAPIKLELALARMTS
jgi:serine kinase of HPr protein (carbohydrate metabolism regulator)